MKLLWAVATIALAAACVSACGSAGKAATTAAQASAPAASQSKAVDAVPGAGIARGLKGLKGDEDDDDAESVSMGSNPATDSDNDTDNDYRDNAVKGYYDGDDAPIRDYGHAAGGADEQALTAVVKRYYAAAVAEDGNTACKLIAPAVARAVSEEYGQGSGAPSLRGLRSCPALLSALFKRTSGELAVAMKIATVRVQGERAYVLVGSTNTPAGFLTLQREGGVWRIEGLAASQLP
jgi:hypothetical protein